MPRAPGGSPSFPGVGGGSDDDDSGGGGGDSSDSDSDGGSDDGPRSPGGSPSFPGTGGGSADGSGSGGGSSGGSGGGSDGPRSPGGSPSFPGTGGGGSDDDSGDSGGSSGGSNDDGPRSPGGSPSIPNVGGGGGGGGGSSDDGPRSPGGSPSIPNVGDDMPDDPADDAPTDTDETGDMDGAADPAEAVVPDPAEQRAERQLEDRLGVDLDADDVTVSPAGVDGGARQFEAELTAEGRREIVADRTPFVEPDDLRVTDSGVELTSEGRREFRGQLSDLRLPVASLGARTGDDVAASARQGFVDEARRQEARDQAVEQVEEQTQRQLFGAPGAAAVDVAERVTGRELIDFDAGTDVALDQQDGQIQAELTEQRRREIASGTIEGQLEAETGAELDDEDITLEEGDDGALVGRLSEEGEKTVAVQNNPFTDAPVIGGGVETFTRGRQEFIDITDPVAEGFRDVTPSKREFFGGLAAAAPVAAAEPTPIGELSLGAAAAGGAAVVGGAAVASAARGSEPTARERSELDIGEVSVPELGVPDDTGDTGELQPGDRQVSELEPGGRVDSELSIPSETGRDVTTVVTGGQVGQQRQRERERPAPDEPTITREDIAGEIVEPDQPGPSIREQQRRDELFPPDREFPTGESAVVGRGTAEDTTEDIIERQQEAQRSELLDEGRIDVAEELALGTDQQPRQDTGPIGRGGTRSQTDVDIDQQIDQALDTPQITEPRLGTPGATTTEDPFEQRFGVQVETQLKRPVVESPAEGRPRRGDSRLSGIADDPRRRDDELGDFKLESELFEFDVTEPGEIVSGAAFEIDSDRKTGGFL